VAGAPEFGSDSFDESTNNRSQGGPIHHPENRLELQWVDLARPAIELE
jgi:hypothetical protein